MKRYVYINDDESSHDLYCDNRISNRKYTLLNFLPKNLWEQFRWFFDWHCWFHVDSHHDFYGSLLEENCEHSVQVINWVPKLSSDLTESLLY